MMENKRIAELTVQVTETVIAQGVDPLTAWAEHTSAYKPLILMHVENGKEYLDEGIVRDFLNETGMRVDKGEVGWPHYRRVQRGIERLLEYNLKGVLGWTFYRKVSKFKLNPYYEKVISDFLSVSEFHPNTQGDIVWIARKYFAWLICEGKHDLHNVEASEIQKFLIYCSKHMKMGSIHNTKVYLKKLYAYLEDCGLSQDNYEELLSFRVVRGTRVYPAASPDDLAKTLEQVDRRIPKGKRDYAIIMLGAVTGLRAIDIARIKLTDIDWQRGEIKIVQEKTGVSLALPLTKDVGKAIEEYILFGRPSTESTEIFIRNHKPYRGFKDSVSIGDMYDVYRKKAGLPRDAFDGNCFHSLRRGVGKNLITSHTPVKDAAQVLGIKNLDIMKKYIALDSVHLKECALSFEGIEPSSPFFDMEGGDSQ